MSTRDSLIIRHEFLRSRDEGMTNCHAIACLVLRLIKTQSEAYYECTMGVPTSTNMLVITYTEFCHARENNVTWHHHASISSEQLCRQWTRNYAAYHLQVTGILLGNQVISLLPCIAPIPNLAMLLKVHKTRLYASSHFLLWLQKDFHFFVRFVT